jgi:hypothetical protein
VHALRGKNREQLMKIAAVSEDVVTISQHFGRAPFYIVVTIEDGKVISREKREKMGHAQFAGKPHGDHGSGADPRGHGFEPEAQGRHARMAEAIQAYLAGTLTDHVEKPH